MIDYDQLANDLKTRVATVTAFARVAVDQDDRDFSFENMPNADIRYLRGIPEVRVGQDYVLSLIFEVQITAFSLTSGRDAAMIRNQLLKDTQNAVRAQPRFSASLETVTLGEMDFASQKSDTHFMSTVVFQVIATIFADRS